MESASQDVSPACSRDRMNHVMETLVNNYSYRVVTINLEPR